MKRNARFVGGDRPPSLRNVGEATLDFVRRMGRLAFSLRADADGLSAKVDRLRRRTDALLARFADAEDDVGATSNRREFLLRCLLREFRKLDSRACRLGSGMTRFKCLPMELSALEAAISGPFPENVSDEELWSRIRADLIPNPDVAFSPPEPPPVETADVTFAGDNFWEDGSPVTFPSFRERLVGLVEHIDCLRITAECFRDGCDRAGRTIEAFLAGKREEGKTDVPRSSVP